MPRPNVPLESIVGYSSALSAWRTQENIDIAFIAVYIYYFFTTLDEEVTVFAPQMRRPVNLGTVLFLIIRYMTLMWIPIHVTRDYRTYVNISPASCKAMLVISWATFRLAVLASDIALGLCLCALLGGVGRVTSIFIMLVSSGSSFAFFILYFVGAIQYPATTVSSFDQELGYPCYAPSDTGFESTIGGADREIGSYVAFGTSAVLFIVAISTVVVRYRQQNGQLIQVLKRDGGIYYLAATASRFASAMLFTSTVMSIENLGGSPAATIVEGIDHAILPILAQRLLLNMRRVDYIESGPFVSTLAFTKLEDCEGASGIKGGA